MDIQNENYELFCSTNMADNTPTVNELPKLDNSIQEEIVKELSLNHVEVCEIAKISNKWRIMFNFFQEFEYI